jgi:hypothetical protein
MKRIVVVLVLLAGVAALDAGGAPARAEGATIAESGWWSRSPGTATPEGGYEVGKTPEGELSVTAFRLAIDEPVSSALLILAEAPGGALPESAVIDVCPTTAPWTPASPGPLEEAPAADCATKVPLVRNASSGNWTADLTSLLAGASAGSTVSVVLKPGAVTAIVPPAPPAVSNPAPAPIPVPTTLPVSPTVPTPVDPGFTVEFSKADLIASGSGGGASAGPSPTPSSSSGGIASGGTSSGFESTFAPTFTPTDSYASSAAPSVTPTPEALPAARAEVTTGGAGGAGTAANVEAGLQPVAASRGGSPPWGRLLLLVPLSAAIGAAGSTVRRRFLPVGAG